MANSNQKRLRRLIKKAIAKKKPIPGQNVKTNIGDIKNT